MGKVSEGFKSFPKSVDGFVQSMERTQKATASATSSQSWFGNMLGKFTAPVFLTAASRQIAAGARKWIDSSNDYVENLNLFMVAMDDAALSAINFADKVYDSIGIDQSQWMRYQGFLKQIGEGFGMTVEKSTLMSQQLTQIGYDISSFFNLKVDEAMRKVQSGIAGELEPLRRIGYALDQNTLKEIARRHGIEKTFNLMTQNEKAQLRYIAIMEQSSNVMGDMAATVQSPANAMRIFQQQVVLLQRALGNLLLPTIQVILPYLTAFVKLAAEVIQALALHFGFEMPQIEFNRDNPLAYPEVTTDALGDIEDAVADNGNAAEKAGKQWENFLFGFDKLNKMPKVAEALGGASGGLGGKGSGLTGLGDEFDLNLPSYDFLENAIGSSADRIRAKLQPFFDWIMDNLDTILSVLKAIALAWATVAIADFIAGLFGQKLPWNVKMGLAITIVGLSLLWDAIGDMVVNGLSARNVIQAAIGAALGIGGSLLMFGTGPLGWTVGIALVMSVGLLSYIYHKNKQAYEAEVKKRFGELHLTDEQIAQYTQSIVARIPVYTELQVFQSSKDTYTEVVTELNAAIKDVEKYNFKIKLGLHVTQESYEAAIDHMLGKAQEYLVSQQEMVSIAIGISLGDTDAGTQLQQFTTEYYAAGQEKLAELGTKLRQAVSDAFVDGEFIPDKMQKAIDLQNEIQELIQYYDRLEFEANLISITTDISIDNLDRESYKRVLDELNVETEKVLANLQESRVITLAQAKLQFDENVKAGMSRKEAQGIYDNLVDEINRKFRTDSLEIQAVTAEFTLDPIVHKFGEEIDISMDQIQGYLNDSFTSAQGSYWGNASFTTGEQVSLFLDNIYVAYQSGMIVTNQNMSKETRKLIEELLYDLEPTAKDLQELATEYKKAGLKVPEGLSEGLTNYHSLKALENDAESINWLVGQKFSQDPSFIKMLQSVEAGGLDVPDAFAEGVLDNLGVVYDATKDTVTFMSDTFGKQVVQATPELIQNLKDLGFVLEDKGKSDSKTRVQNVVSTMSKELQSKSPILEKDMKNIANDMLKNFEPGDTRNRVKKVMDDIAQYLRDNGYKIQQAFGAIWVNGVKMIYDPISKSLITWNSYLSEIKRSAQTVKISTNPSGQSVSFSPANTKHVIQPYATGGLPGSGDLFMANENGIVEMVGKLGGGAGVANNQQIESQIYKAVRDGMRDSGGGQSSGSIHVHVDSKEVAKATQASIRRQNARAGRTVIGV